MQRIAARASKGAIFNMYVCKVRYERHTEQPKSEAPKLALYVVRFHHVRRRDAA